MDEIGGAGGSVTVGEHDVAGFELVTVQARGGSGVGAAVWHGVAVDVVGLAEIIMRFVDDFF